MTLLRHDDLSLYFFGVRTGISNLVQNRFQLGPRKTIGKITQPVNYYSRYPEYSVFFRNLKSFTGQYRDGTPRILDIGSPKLFGLYLAYNLNVNLVMTDISSANIDEYVLMWDSIKKKARGEAGFELQDVRSLHYRPESFDAVYSMSVVEHVEGGGADRKALLEMLRVLKPGGLLIFSVPIGQRHVEQLRPLSSGDHKGSGASQDEFFQRIYNRETIEERLLSNCRQMISDDDNATIIRIPAKFLMGYLKLGLALRGFLGMLNPILSARYTAELSEPGEEIPSHYGKRHSASDIYGDFVYWGIKKD